MNFYLSLNTLQGSSQIEPLKTIQITTAFQKHLIHYVSSLGVQEGVVFYETGESGGIGGVGVGKNLKM